MVMHDKPRSPQARGDSRSLTVTSALFSSALFRGAWSSESDVQFIDHITGVRLPSLNAQFTPLLERFGISRMQYAYRMRMKCFSDST